MPTPGTSVDRRQSTKSGKPLPQQKPPDSKKSPDPSKSATSPPSNPQAGSLSKHHEQADEQATAISPANRRKLAPAKSPRNVEPSHLSSKESLPRKSVSPSMYKDPRDADAATPVDRRKPSSPPVNPEKNLEPSCLSPKAKLARKSVSLHKQVPKDVDDASPTTIPARKASKTARMHESVRADKDEDTEQQWKEKLEELEKKHEDDVYYQSPIKLRKHSRKESSVAGNICHRKSVSADRKSSSANPTSKGSSQQAAKGGL